MNSFFFFLSLFTFSFSLQLLFAHSMHIVGLLFNRMPSTNLLARDLFIFFSEMLKARLLHSLLASILSPPIDSSSTNNRLLNSIFSFSSLFVTHFPLGLSIIWVFLWRAYIHPLPPSPPPLPSSSTYLFSYVRKCGHNTGIQIGYVWCRLCMDLA